MKWVVPHSRVVDKIRKDTWGATDPGHKPDCAAQGSSARKIKPHNVWLQKPVGWQKKLPISQESQFKESSKS